MRSPGQAIRYLALLRGINVGGKKVIAMQELRRVFEDAGFGGVSTFIQSGNVFFESSEEREEVLQVKLEGHLHRALCYEVPVVLRTAAEVEGLVRSDPFAGRTPGPDIKWYAAFLQREPARRPALPLSSPKGDMELFHLERRVAYVLSHRIAGRFGFPNNFVEEMLGVVATTRNWNTVCRMVS